MNKKFIFVDHTKSKGHLKYLQSFSGFGVNKFLTDVWNHNLKDALQLDKVDMDFVWNNIFHFEDDTIDLVKD